MSIIFELTSISFPLSVQNAIYHYDIYRRYYEKNVVVQVNYNKKDNKKIIITKKISKFQLLDLLILTKSDAIVF